MKTVNGLSMHRLVKIRVSAFVGTFDAEPARATIADGSYAQGINDLLTEENENRQVNAVTAILGNVANMTWLEKLNTM